MINKIKKFLLLTAFKTQLKEVIKAKKRFLQKQIEIRDNTEYTTSEIETLEEVLTYLKDNSFEEVVKLVNEEFNKTKEKKPYVNTKKTNIIARHEILEAIVNWFDLKGKRDLDWLMYLSLI